MNISTRISSPSQKAEKLPATKPGQDVQRRAALLGRGDDLLARGGSAVLVKILVNSGISAPGERAAADDHRQHPPQRAAALEAAGSST